MRQYASPVFMHRHYAAIAAILAAQPGGADPVLVDSFVNVFARDNDRFQESRFRAAASGKPSNGKDKR